MKSLTPEIVTEIASRLKINDHVDGRLSLWVPNKEQKQLWVDLFCSQLLYVLKGRQIGASTAVCLWDVLWVAVNDADGEKVRLGIVVDTDAKAFERLSVCADFARQLGLTDGRTTGRTLRFPNGSEIMAVTAGGRRAGASMTFHSFHFTELPFWRDPRGSYTSLMQALVLDGRVVVETTMGIDDMTAKDLWVETNDFVKRFFPFEDHTEYRADPVPELLTPDLEKYLRDHGFTNREAMAYWIWLLRNRCNGDVVRCFREYPQKPEHSWTYAEGRWVAVTPIVLEPLESVRMSGVGSTCYLDIYRRAEDGSGQYVIGVDTGGGLGRDSSVVVVVDARDFQVCASFVSAEVPIDDLAEIALETQNLYRSVFKHPRFGAQVRVPPVVVEDNGIGLATLQACRSRSVQRLIEFHASKPSQLEGLTLIKRYVESGVLFGPKRLADECDSLRTEGGKFLGSKDLCMGISFCYSWLADNPYSPDLPSSGRMVANFLSQLGGR